MYHYLGIWFKRILGETINIFSHKRLSPCLTELNTENIAPLSSPQKFDTEKKFNLVLYGVKECCPGMSKSAKFTMAIKHIPNQVKKAMFSLLAILPIPVIMNTYETMLKPIMCYIWL